MARNRLREAANVLQDRMEQDASEIVVYKRRSTGEVFSVPAVIGQTLSEEDSGDGYTIRITTRDFTIRRVLLSNIKPERNDEIIFEDVVYIVSTDSGESHFLETDPYAVAWRIHTKEDRKSA